MNCRSWPNGRNIPESRSVISQHNWDDRDGTGKECRRSGNLWLDLLAAFVSNSIRKIPLCFVYILPSLSGRRIFPSPIHLQSSQSSIKYQLTFYLLHEVFPNFYGEAWVPSTLGSPETYAYFIVLCSAQCIG